MSHIMIVVSPYYKEIADLLLAGVKAVLDDKNCTYEVFEVEGALEIPLAIKYGILRRETRGANNMRFSAFIALGCVIRGETSHYDIVCEESARGLSQLSLEHIVPIGNGILTCNTMDQAYERADPNKKNKGADTAKAVLSLLKTKRELGV
ncbi:MAG: 6,7-dimethyl-8-ribityllumazine synthase [Alphaproteobacteria bacterium]|nr:6,7-dimethyl-8-ribityllumazine synthase [Alphaproteobacteria bacterium]